MNTTTQLSPDYSFCESVTASGRSPWHIRQLTQEGYKPGGGTDTPSLCGRKMGWDLEVKITEHHLGHACETCVAAFEQKTKKLMAGWYKDGKQYVLLLWRNRKLQKIRRTPSPSSRYIHRGRLPASFKNQAPKEQP